MKLKTLPLREVLSTAGAKLVDGLSLHELWALDSALLSIKLHLISSEVVGLV
jgi:hypothetical protein